MKLILLPILLFCSLSASAQKAKQDSTPVLINTMDLVMQEIRINPKDTALMHEKEIMQSYFWLISDPSVKIYSKTERDSIVIMVKTYNQK